MGLAEDVQALKTRAESLLGKQRFTGVVSELVTGFTDLVRVVEQLAHAQGVDVPPPPAPAEAEPAAADPAAGVPAAAPDATDPPAQG